MQQHYGGGGLLLRPVQALQGRERWQVLKLKPGQLNTSVLAKLFHLFPESIVLVSEDGCVETADDDGDFQEVDDLPTWSVTGESTKPTSVAAAGSSAGVSPLAYSYQLPGKKGGRKWTPRFTTSTLAQRQMPPGVRAQEQYNGAGAAGPSVSEPEWRKNVEVCKWSEREGQWKKVSNLPVSLTETTANIARVAQMGSEDAFGGEQCMLLDNEYLKLLDTPSTRGRFTVKYKCLALEIVVPQAEIHLQCHNLLASVI